MTKKRKIEILEGAKKTIRGKYWYTLGVGLCWAVDKQLTEKEREKYRPYGSLRFLRIKKPKQTYNLVLWFPITKEGDAKRIKLCNQAIKELKSNLPPQTRVWRRGSR